MSPADTPGSDDERSRIANELRKELVHLKVSTLMAQALRMGLKLPGEEISASALRKIQDSVVELNAEELEKDIAHWTELSRRAARSLAAQQEAQRTAPPRPPEPPKE